MIRRILLGAAMAAAAAPALAQYDTLTVKPIVKAAREGDEEKVRQALLKGENPNQIDTASGQPLLVTAVMAGQIGVVETLLKGGAIVDSTDRDGYTPLIRAAEKGDVDIVDVLLKHRAKSAAQSRQGDKRIILIDGKPVGVINRVPAEGEARSNMHVGGRPEPIEMTPRDRVICETIGPTLKARGLIFVGIDVIGEYLTEINVTSPTGIREVKRFGGPDIAALVWDAIEARR